jgi:hypothetical protein
MNFEKFILQIRTWIFIFLLNDNINGTILELHIMLYLFYKETYTYDINISFSHSCVLPPQYISNELTDFHEPSYVYQDITGTPIYAHFNLRASLY